MEVRVIYFYANLLLWVFYIQYVHAIEREDPALHCAPSTKSQMQEFCSGKSFKMGIKSGLLRHQKFDFKLIMKEDKKCVGL